MKGESTLDHATLLFMLKYEPETGAWYWLKPNATNVKSGDRAGCIRKTHSGSGKEVHRWFLIIGNEQFIASRVAWFYMTGKWPEKTIDHIDRDSLNDRWNNLRDRSYSAQNLNRVLPIGSTGFRGVFLIRKTGRFGSYIMRHKKRSFLGSFATPEEASAAYETARDAYSIEVQSHEID